MAQITLKGNACNTCGDLPSTGAAVKDFSLTGTDLSDVSLSTFKGKRIVMNVFPSIDTPVCATSVRKFNETASNMENTVVLCISKDLPFAHKRFCSTEELENVLPLSMYKNDSFGKDYGLEIVDGPLSGLFSRAIVVVGEDGKVLHSEQVGEIADEPNYDAAIAALS